MRYIRPDIILRATQQAFIQANTLVVTRPHKDAIHRQSLDEWLLPVAHQRATTRVYISRRGGVCCGRQFRR